MSWEEAPGEAPGEVVESTENYFDYYYPDSKGNSLAAPNHTDSCSFQGTVLAATGGRYRSRTIPCPHTNGSFRRD